MSREILDELSQQLRDLEDQALCDTPEYEEIADEFEALSMSRIPLLEDSSYYALYVYQIGELEAEMYGEYDSYEHACDLADEMVDDGDIEGYYVLTSDEIEDDDD